MPSDTEIQRKADKRIDQIKKSLTFEIQEDVKEHKSIAVTSDGGNSGDQNKTKKNTITVTRITEDFKMKTDTVAVPEAVGSQTGVTIRSQWKTELLKIGYMPDWKLLFTTDAAKNVRSARQVGRHNEVGLDIKWEGDCVDHQIHLCIEESLKQLPNLKGALMKSRKLINHFSKSTLSRQLLSSIQAELGLPNKWILVGTKN